MIQHVRANLWLVATTLVICCVLYPLLLLGIGQSIFHNTANGSLILDHNGLTIGSRLIAQPFTSDQYFQPRPSAISYNAAASGASNLGASNCKLRDRVAQALGPIVKYATGAKKGEPVGPDIEAWFAEQDRTKTKAAPGVLSRWADAHPSAVQAWVSNADPALSKYISDWQKSHPKDVAEWVKDNPGTPQPQATDIAAIFFKSFSDEHPGRFPSAASHTAGNGKTEMRIDLVSDGTDIQSALFDMWLAAHPKAELQQVPADMLTTSASGLDPDITLAAAEYQIDRVAGAWAKQTKRDKAQVRREIESTLQERANAPLGGLVGVKLVNVLEMNLALANRYQTAPVAMK